MRITRLVGSLYVTPTTGWTAMTSDITSLHGVAKYCLMKRGYQRGALASGG
jgi:hypothetical protein